MSIDGQQFCDSYVKNDYKVLVHSPDNQVLTLIVNHHFWIVDLKNESQSLVFRSADLSPSGSNDVLGPHISTLFSSYDVNPPQYFVTFYDVRHEYH